MAKRGCGNIHGYLCAVAGVHVASNERSTKLSLQLGSSELVPHQDVAEGPAMRIEEIRTLLTAEEVIHDHITFMPIHAAGQRMNARQRLRHRRLRALPLPGQRRPSLA